MYLNHIPQQAAGPQGYRHHPSPPTLLQAGADLRSESSALEQKMHSLSLEKQVGGGVVN